MLPLVSCILPTGYGDKFVSLAIQCFLDQTYEGPLELVIVDNNEADISIGVEIPEGEERFAVTYLRAPRGKSVGFYRNLGTRAATGEICISWDEDDWFHPDRVAAQVKRLQESGKAVTGWHNILYWNDATGEAFKYLNSPTGHKVPPYAMGTSQCYLKSWWEKHKFVEDGVEDWPFSNAALHEKQLDSCDAEQLCVARVHSRNAVQKQLGSRHFPKVERTALPEEFFAAIGEKQQTKPPMAENKE